MANELTISGSLCVTDATSPTRALQSGDVSATITKDGQILQKIPVAIVATPIPVNNLTSPGWAIFINRDPTNYIDIYSDNGVNKKAIARLFPNTPCGPIFLGTDCKAPYALANVAPCIMEFLICDT